MDIIVLIFSPRFMLFVRLVSVRTNDGFPAGRYQFNGAYTRATNSAAHEPSMSWCETTAISPGSHCDEAHLEEAEALLASVGKVLRVPEKQQDAVTAISGSGPAYFFLVMEALEQAAIEAGLDPKQARLLTLETAFGAAKMALDEVKGQVAGYKIELVFLDDASPTTGSWDGTVEATNAQKAIADERGLAYFGTYNSGAAKISMPLTNEAGMAQITPANSYPGLTKSGYGPGEPGIYRPTGKVNYFRTFGADDFQGASGAAWAKCLGFKKVYILDDRQLYGKGIADVFDKHAKKIGLNVAAHDGIESVNIDFRALLTKVKASGADLIYFGGLVDSGGPQPFLRFLSKAWISVSVERIVRARLAENAARRRR